MPYRQGSEEVARALLSNNELGLSEKEAEQRLNQYGKNQLEQDHKESLLKNLLQQLKDPMILVLLVGAVISGLLKEYMDSFIILFVILLNAFIGMFQEYKAEKALAALEKLSNFKAIIKRGGVSREIDSNEIVVGDLVILEAGCYIPADLRLTKSVNLKVEESSLTGESIAVEKDANVIFREDLPLAERKNMAFASTFVTYGRGSGIVVATAMDSEIGKIASMLKNQKENATPLQQRLFFLSKVLGGLAVFICILMFFIAVVQKRDLFEMLLTAISLAVAAIPEGLPAVVTISLALGVVKMSKSKAIARKLHAVETLGCVSVICSDKTGTLTQNKMSIQQIYLNNKIEEVDYSLKINRVFLEGFLLCNDAYIEGDKEVGDPTELAFVKWAKGYQLDKKTLEKMYPRVHEVPFDSKRKLMSTIHRMHHQNIVYTKGAVDVLLSKCQSVYLNGHVVSLTQELRMDILSATSTMAGKAMRVLALATRTIEHPQDPYPESLLTFIGLAGMIDPARVEVKEAIKKCKQAQVQVVMITGDHPDTAYAIASNLQIASNPNQVLNANRLDGLSDEEFERDLMNYRVFARVSPENKVRIVTAFQHKGLVVAMTGDGVNDAPALKKADVGVAMGSGTDVSKQASDLILVDDNFATIVQAVEKGRNIYLNIQKAVLYLLSCNLGEIVTLFLAVLLMPFAPTPLSAIQILWVNLVTDAFPALALAAEPDDPFIMEEKPRHQNESLFAHGGWWFMVLNGLFIGTISLVAFRFGYAIDSQTGHTMSFMVLSISQLFHCLNLRSLNHSIFQVGLLKNKYLLITFVLGIVIQMGITMIPIMNTLLKIVPLNLFNWMIVLGLSSSIVLVNELSKYLGREN